MPKRSVPLSLSLSPSPSLSPSLSLSLFLFLSLSLLGGWRCTRELGGAVRERAEKREGEKHPEGCFLNLCLSVCLFVFTCLSPFLSLCLSSPNSPRPPPQSVLIPLLLSLSHAGGRCSRFSWPRVFLPPRYPAVFRKRKRNSSAHLFRIIQARGAIPKHVDERGVRFGCIGARS